MMTRAVAIAILSASATMAAQAPPRDAAASVAATPGTATIRGRVVDAKTGSPMRGVQISASTGERRVASTGTPINGRVAGVYTNGDGRYELRNLSGGRYHLTAQSAGYLDLEYGQTRPAQSGTPVVVRDKETVENVNFVLPLGAAVAGTVRDQNGDAMANVQVRVLRPVYREGRNALNAEVIVITDDLGSFRVFGLVPGSIFLSVLAPVPGAQGGVAFENTGAGLAPTYYPGTTNFAEARPLTVKLEETLNNVDFTVVSVNNASIRGVVTESDRPASNLQGTASQVGPGLLFSYPMRVQPDGSFTVENLTPGDYEVRITGVSTTSDRSPLVSIERITLADGEIRELRPTLTRMSTGSGRLLVDAVSGAALAGTIFQIVPEPRTNAVLYQARPANSLTTVRVQADLRFTFSVPPGRAVITPYTLPRGWYVKAMRLNGLDVSDGIDFPVGGAADGIDIELTNHPSEITGTARSANGQPAQDYTVLVFTRDPARRRGVTRYFATTRPDQEGTFRVLGLPPGDYFAVALEYADPDTSADPTFLDSLAREATPFTLGEDEPKKLELPLVH